MAEEKHRPVRRWGHSRADPTHEGKESKVPKEFKLAEVSNDTSGSTVATLGGTGGGGLACTSPAQESPLNEDQGSRWSRCRKEQQFDHVSLDSDPYKTASYASAEPASKASKISTSEATLSVAGATSNTCLDLSAAHSNALPADATKAALRNARRRTKRQEKRASSAAEAHPGRAQEVGPCIVWVRDDLRLRDNGALLAAAESGQPVVVLYVHDTEDPCPWPLRGSALWWKGRSLQAFDASLCQNCTSRFSRQRLVIRKGNVEEEILKVAKEVEASSVYFNRQCEPWYHERDCRVAAALRAKSIAVKTFQGACLMEPWGHDVPEVLQSSRSHKRTPGQKDTTPVGIWDEVEPGKLERRDDPPTPADSVNLSKHTLDDITTIINSDRLLSNPNPCAQLLTAIFTDQSEVSDHRRRDPDHYLVYQDVEAGNYMSQPFATVSGRELPSPSIWLESIPIEELGYLRTAGRGFPKCGEPQFNEQRQQGQTSGISSEDNWAAAMDEFWKVGEDAAIRRLHEFVENIETHKRPHRHRGDQRWTSLMSPYLRFGEISPRTCYCEAMKAPFALRHGFIRRVLWRDLSYAELYKWPDMPSRSQRLQYEDEWWSGSQTQLRRWQHGTTGFPLVDAAMRQLWKEGWICNYLRHVTAGFLIDYLDISWKEGFKWYDYTLVDSDVAINARLWQQGGHSGISQWNFVMHPVFAAKNADPTGEYVRRWVPELRGLPTEFIHCPWMAMGAATSFGVKFGSTYPKRMVLDIEAARQNHLRNVLKVRKMHPETVSPDGTEYLLLSDGSRVLLRTRNDIRQDTEELVVAQTADGTLHKRPGGSSSAKRPAFGSQEMLMGDEINRHAGGYHAVANLDIL